MKAEKLLLEMIIIVLLVSVVCFWTLNEWRKRYPITGNLGEMRISKASRFTHNFSPVKPELVFKRDFERANRIRDIQNILYGVKMGTRGITRQAHWELKDELHRLLGDSKPVKTYAGVWHETYLEVMK